MGNQDMSDDFEDHCWKDIVTPDVLDIYTHYRRKTFVGPAPALLAIDLYELVYQGGPKPPAELAKTYPSACGEYAYAAIEPTKRLFAAARAAGLPIFYSTGDTRSESRPALRRRATKRAEFVGRSVRLTSSGRSSSRSRATSSSPSSAPARSTARRSSRISPSSASRR